MNGATELRRSRVGQAGKGSTAIGQSAPDAISVFVRKAAEARKALLNTYLAVAESVFERCS